MDRRRFLNLLGITMIGAAVVGPVGVVFNGDAKTRTEWTAGIVHVAVYDRALTDKEIMQVYAYVNERYGLTGG